MDRVAASSCSMAESIPALSTVVKSVCAQVWEPNWCPSATMRLRKPSQVGSVIWAQLSPLMKKVACMLAALNKSMMPPS